MTAIPVSNYRRQTNENNQAEPQELWLFSGQKCTALADRLLAGAATQEEQRAPRAEHDENGLQLVRTNEFLPCNWRHLSG